MALDIIPALHPLLDGFSASAGGRTQAFTYIPWGRHWDDRRWAAVTGTNSVFSIRPVFKPKRNADIGGGAALARQQVDVMVWWADGSDITDPDEFRKAVEAAVTVIIRANEKTVTSSTFTQVVNVVNGDELLGGETATLKHLAIITVQGESDEVYA